MSRQATTLRELARVRAENHGLLLRLGLRTALGRKNFTSDDTPTGAPCIIFYVSRRLPESALDAQARIPEVIESTDRSMFALTDAVEINPDPIQAPLPGLGQSNQALRSILRWSDPPPWPPLRPGCRLSYGRATEGGFTSHSGTLGCLVRDTAHPELVGLLTNHHIGPEPGQSLYRPDYAPGAQRIAMVRRTLHHLADEAWLRGVDEPNTYMIIDASFAELSEGVARENTLLSMDGAQRSTEPLGRVYPIDYDSMDIIGKPVRKIGQRSGIQLGMIVAVGISQPHPSQDIDANIGQDPARYYADLAIVPRHPSRFVSAPGDSGSLVVIDTDDASRNQPE
ncbi:MAG: hypothetical protein ACI8RZ_004124, partial [Myxococcota bacterium]